MLDVNPWKYVACRYAGLKDKPIYDYFWKKIYSDILKFYLCTLIILLLWHSNFYYMKLCTVTFNQPLYLLPMMVVLYIFKGFLCKLRRKRCPISMHISKKSCKLFESLVVLLYKKPIFNNQNFKIKTLKLTYWHGFIFKAWTARRV